jgi:hypothetical protein
MPQPALPLNKYLSAQLPAVRENFPAGGGATGERKQYDGVLTGVSIVDDFKSLVSSCEYGLSVQVIPPPTCFEGFSLNACIWS